MKVLVVDDDASVRESVSKVLKDEGYAAVLARDGEEALKRFEEGSVDLLMLDIGLPIKDGWDVFERITSQDPVLPIIIITGRPNQFRTAIAAGVGSLMEKPLDPPLLLKTIRELMAEPKEARLRRLCGYRQDIRYVPNDSAAFLKTLREHFSKPTRDTP